MASAPMVPFNAASHMYVERFTRVLPAIIGASAIDVSPTQNAVQTYGYLRSILIWQQTAASGTAGSGSYNPDAPQILASQISLTDPNGAEIYGGPVWSGYDTYLSEKYGSYFLVNDATLSPLYSASITSPKFPYRIWLEMNSNSGLGSLPNMDAQSPYKLKVTQNTSTLLYTTAPTTAPTLEWDYYIESWTVPEPVNRITGQPQAIAPLGLGQVAGYRTARRCSTGRNRPRRSPPLRLHARGNPQRKHFPQRRLDGTEQLGCASDPRERLPVVHHLLVGRRADLQQHRPELPRGEVLPAGGRPGGIHEPDTGHGRDRVPVCEPVRR